MASLDISLDDMIKKSKTNNRRTVRAQPRGRGFVVRGGQRDRVPRRNPLGVSARPSAIAKPVSRTRKAFWQTDLFEDGLKAAGFSGRRDTKLYVSNLDSGVTNEDIRELFSKFGELVRYAIHYDRNGRPSGSAELIFARRSDAIHALKRYNNVKLDGKPMKIEIIGASAEIPLSARVNVVRGANVNIVGGANRKRTVAAGTGAFHSRGGFTAVNRGFGQRGRGGLKIERGGRGQRGGGRGGRGGAQQSFKKKIVEKSADELDKELEMYHAEAMQT